MPKVRDAFPRLPKEPIKLPHGATVDLRITGGRIGSSGEHKEIWVFPQGLTIKQKRELIAKGTKKLSPFFGAADFSNIVALLPPSPIGDKALNVRALRKETFSALKNAKTYKQIRAQRRRAAGPQAAFREDVRARNKWARSRFQRLRKQGERFDTAIDRVRQELKRRKFGCWKGTQLSLEAIRRIVHSRR